MKIKVNVFFWYHRPQSCIFVPKNEIEHDCVWISYLTRASDTLCRIRHTSTALTTGSDNTHYHKNQGPQKKKEISLKTIPIYYIYQYNFLWMLASHGFDCSSVLITISYFLVAFRLLSSRTNDWGSVVFFQFQNIYQLKITENKHSI